ncbi:hypothetical protein kac68v162_gp145 [Nodularia phage vB_NspS-kac68v162]|uniref:Phosphoadenosine phosphosulfate reductase n=1 Tax=Nodularia phage vB_NspS-kac68v162 TaxID=2557583 RepID=A0A482MLN3_9CAUD|nr:hypothetical protein kac68v162_gp145 [Nodularia phage vB_NspS-kac68v162]
MLSNTLLSDVDQADLILQNTRGIANTTVSSLSGGRTSSYMAIHYPTDVNLFAVVLTDDHLSVPRDKGLEREMIRRIPHFKASRELDETLKVVLALEQKLGKEIKFLASDRTFDDVIRAKNALPNRRTRFCTIEMKLKPIFEWCYLNLLNPTLGDTSLTINNVVEMNIGFRWDEAQRVFRNLGASYSSETKSLDWSTSGGCEPLDFSHKCDIAGTFKGKHRWIKSADWRFKQFPLYTDRVTQSDVRAFWDKHPPFIFPEVSNCDYCFFHRTEEMEKQFKANPIRYFWWNDKEREMHRTFGDKRLKDRFASDTPQTDSYDFNEACSCTD